MNLSTILPPTPEQRRQTQETISVAEKPIKELIFAYFNLFEKSAGPKFTRYREADENIKNFKSLPATFVDKDSLYYLPEVQSCPTEEVMIEQKENTRIWEKWELQPSLVPDDVVWDVDKKISSLSNEEATRINSVIGKLLHVIQISWQIIVGRYEETKKWKLHMNPDNLTLSLIDSAPISKADHLKIRLGIIINVKDKIEIDN